MQLDYQCTNAYIKIDPKKQFDLYPFCIVWTLLPCISWFIPWIGHTGICDNQGVIYDFLGFHINKRNMAFGNPKKYVPLKLAQNEVNAYLEAFATANTQFSNLGHDLCCNNCHHHVAHVLNLFKYKGRNNWTQVSVWWMCIWQSYYVAWWSPLVIYLPFLVIVTVIVILSVVTSK